MYGATGTEEFTLRDPVVTSGRTRRFVCSVANSVRNIEASWNGPDPIDAAIRNLWLRPRFLHGERHIIIACLVRTPDWRPLKAPWWHGKEVCVIGADLEGNFLLRHCDGTVRYWDHRLQVDAVLAPSIRDFVSKLVE
jgi:hypothetical protein